MERNFGLAGRVESGALVKLDVAAAGPKERDATARRSAFGFGLPKKMVWLINVGGNGVCRPGRENRLTCVQR